jgi:hypothetical protein
VKNGSRGEHDAGVTERLAHSGGMSSAAEAYFRSRGYTDVADVGADSMAPRARVANDGVLTCDGTTMRTFVAVEHHSETDAVQHPHGHRDDVPGKCVNGQERIGISAPGRESAQCRIGRRRDEGRVRSWSPGTFATKVPSK